MNLQKPIGVALSAILVATLAAAQGTKDPQAVTLIAACLTASGGPRAIGAIQDFSASGTASFNFDTQTQAAVVLKGRVSTNQFRFDANFSSGTRSWSVTSGAGTLLDTDQSRTTLTHQTAYGLRALSLPILDFVAALSDPNANISYGGLVSSDVGRAYQIHIQEMYTLGVGPSGSLSAATGRDYFIDPNSALILEIKNTLTSSTLHQPFTEAILFAGYRNSNGVLVPFSISEKTSGQHTWSVQLNNVQFNVGLTDADFQL